MSNSFRNRMFTFDSQHFSFTYTQNNSMVLISCESPDYTDGFNQQCDY